MDVRWLAALVASGSALLGVQEVRTFPAEVPTIGAWERVDGRFVDAGLELRWSLYVDPRHPGLYRLTHYQMFDTRPASSAERSLSVEALLWNATPGQRRPLRCFLWQAASPATETGPARGAGWAALDETSASYREEMVRAMQVYALHRKLRLEGPS